MVKKNAVKEYYDNIIVYARLHENSKRALFLCGCFLQRRGPKLIIHYQIMTTVISLHITDICITIRARLMTNQNRNFMLLLFHFEIWPIFDI